MVLRLNYQRLDIVYFTYNIIQREKGKILQGWVAGTTNYRYLDQQSKYMVNLDWFLVRYVGPKLYKDTWRQTIVSIVLVGGGSGDVGVSPLLMICHATLSEYIK